MADTFQTGDGQEEILARLIIDVPDIAWFKAQVLQAISLLTIESNWIEQGDTTIEQALLMANACFLSYRFEGGIIEPDNLKIIQTNDNCWLDANTVMFEERLYAQVGTTNCIGVRFQNPTIPKGVTVASALLTMRTTEEFFDPPNTVRCHGIDRDNAAVWSSTNKPSGNIYTTAFSDIDPDGWTAHVDYTWNVTAIVQEILDRAGYVQGNPFAFRILNSDGSSDYVSFVGFDENPDTCPRLYIEWEE